MKTANPAIFYPVLGFIALAFSLACGGGGSTGLSIAGPASGDASAQTTAATSASAQTLSGPGKLKLRMDLSSLINARGKALGKLDDIAKVLAQVKDGQASSSVELSKVEGTRCTYEGEIQGLPVRSGLTIDVTALNSSGAAIYRGSSLFKLENADPQDVVIAMNPVDDGKGANRPPVIRRVEIDGDVILPDDRLSMRVWAHDQDGHAKDLIFLWSAEKGSFLSGCESQESVWTAPSGYSGTCAIKIAVSDGEDTTVLSFTVKVEDGHALPQPIFAPVLLAFNSSWEGRTLTLAPEIEAHEGLTVCWSWKRSDTMEVLGDESALALSCPEGGFTHDLVLSLGYAEKPVSVDYGFPLVGMKCPEVEAKPAGLIVFSARPVGSEISDLWLCRDDGTGIVRLTDTPAESEDTPVWSPDGSKIAYIAGPKLCVMNRDGTDIRALCPEVGGPILWLDNANLLYRIYNGSQHLTMRIPVSGGQAQVFADRNLSGQWATEATSYDRNAGRVLFICEEGSWDPSKDLYLADVNPSTWAVSNFRTFYADADNNHQDEAPLFSPDGKSVVWMHSKASGYPADHRFQLAVKATTDSGSPSMIGAEYSKCALPRAWSPDGGRILYFVVNESGVYAFRIIGVDGTGDRPWAPLGNGYFYTNADWRAYSDVLAVIKSVTSPSTVAVSPDGKLAWINDNYGGVLAAIDTASNKVARTIATGGLRGNAVALSPDGLRLYASNFSTSSLHVADTSTSSIVGKVGTGGNPQQIAVNADGSTVYVANAYGRSLSIVDAATLSVRATVGGLPSEPAYVSLSRDETKAYVISTSLGDNMLVNEIDLSSRSVTRTLRLGGHPNDLALSLDGRKIYVANIGRTSFSVVDAASLTLTKEIDVGGPSLYLAMSRDGNLLYVPILDSGTVKVVDLRVDRVIRTLTGGAAKFHFTYGAALGLDESRLYVINDGSVVVMATGR